MSNTQSGFAYCPTGEAHGAATYCSIAALDLWNALDRISDRKSLAFMASMEEITKTEDTCYSFWVGTPMTTLGWYDRIVNKEVYDRIIVSNFQGGMFRMNETGPPDITHTHFVWRRYIQLWDLSRNVSLKK